MDTELIKNAPGFYVDSPKIPEGRGAFYTSIPDEIDTICKIRLTGNAYKLVTLYMGINKTDGSFHPTEVWIYNKTGLYGNSYYRARKQLEELNYISFSVNKDESTKITLNYSVIYKDYDEFMKDRPVPEYFSKRKSKTIKNIDEEQSESKKKQVKKKQTATADLKAFMATYNPEEDKDFEFWLFCLHNKFANKMLAENQMIKSANKMLARLGSANKMLAIKNCANKMLARVFLC